MAENILKIDAGEHKVLVVREETSFAQSVLRGFAFTLGTVLAFTVLAVLFGKRF